MEGHRGSLEIKESDGVSVEKGIKEEEKYVTWKSKSNASRVEGRRGIDEKEYNGNSKLKRKIKEN